MIETMSGMPEGVTGFRLGGELTHADYEEVLIPWVNDVVDTGTEVRAVIVVDESFDGYEARAAWDDVKLGTRMETKHRELWKRMALVTDIGWMRHLSKTFGWMAPGELKVFGADEVDAATSWVAEGQ